ncbi:unnamed protein product [Pelagomonas calceolata]|uniref:Sulfotransferase domain-containing protein n=1 Tax=Pelagomonas calceolata TaxID=35677 RepID=A0A7S3ZRG0_9STRA|nr:unnamed protein product [Pelagomonas calceolata]|mmetsp:Transcript_15155/g.43135  ORF Transcript_15155/g.43135 Transcript_15155/m.43135 type:complete len:391 (-) Transcript_15155:62-1234(-)
MRLLAGLLAAAAAADELAPWRRNVSHPIPPLRAMGQFQSTPDTMADDKKRAGRRLRRGRASPVLDGAALASETRDPRVRRLAATEWSIRCQEAGLGLGRAARGAKTVHDVAATVARPWNGTHAPPPRHVIVFLLGYAFSGTSAIHWLLAQAPAVSTLIDPNTLGPKKEGWSVDGLKRGKIPDGQQIDGHQRWADDDTWIPWQHLERTYNSHWDHSKPIFLENSPPEILHPDHLFRQFTRNDTEVRFVVIVRSPCNQHATNTDNHASRMDVVRKIARKYGRRHAFVLRYEDLCDQPRRVPVALEEWLPGLGAGIDPYRTPGAGGRRPTPRGRLLCNHSGCGSHEQMPIPEFCHTAFIPQLPYNTTLPTTIDRNSYTSLLGFFDYNVSSEPN